MTSEPFLEKIEDWAKRHDLTVRTVAALIFHSKGTYLFDLKWNMQDYEKSSPEDQLYFFQSFLFIESSAEDADNLRIKLLYSDVLAIFEDYIAYSGAEFDENEQSIFEISLREWSQSLNLPLDFINCINKFTFPQYKVSDLKVIDFYFLCYYHSDSLFDIINDLFRSDNLLTSQLSALIQLCSDAYVRRQEYRFRDAQLYQLGQTLDDSLDNWGSINKIPKNIVTGLKERYQTVDQVCYWAITRPDEKVKFLTTILVAYDGHVEYVQHFKQVLEASIANYQLSQTLQDQQKKPESSMYIKHPPSALPDPASVFPRRVPPPPPPPPPPTHKVDSSPAKANFPAGNSLPPTITQPTAVENDEPDELLPEFVEWLKDNTTPLDANNILRENKILSQEQLQALSKEQLEKMLEKGGLKVVPRKRVVKAWEVLQGNSVSGSPRTPPPSAIQSLPTVGIESELSVLREEDDVFEADIDPEEWAPLAELKRQRELENDYLANINDCLTDHASKFSARALEVLKFSKAEHQQRSRRLGAYMKSANPDDESCSALLARKVKARDINEVSLRFAPQICIRAVNAGEMVIIAREQLKEEKLPFFNTSAKLSSGTTSKGIPAMEMATAPVPSTTEPAPPVTGWECNMCHLVNDEHKHECRSCFTPRFLNWFCPYCQEENYPNEKHCYRCNNRRPQQSRSSQGSASQPTSKAKLPTSKINSSNMAINHDYSTSKKNGGGMMSTVYNTIMGGSGVNTSNNKDANSKAISGGNGVMEKQSSGRGAK